MYVCKTVQIITAVARVAITVQRYSFANRIIDIWNNLPFEIVCVSSIAAFKRKLNTLHFTPFILAEY